VGARRGHRKHGVIGDTVNLASCLEGRAPVGKVVVGAETLQRLPDGAVVERMPELHVKGKEAPAEAYVLHSL
jgi:class 3 adenylate cyclase